LPITSLRYTTLRLSNIFAADTDRQRRSKISRMFLCWTPKEFLHCIGIGENRNLKSLFRAAVGLFCSVAQTLSIAQAVLRTDGWTDANRQLQTR